MKSNIIKLQPGLYIVPTPIGNLEDITIRARNILTACDAIACEDTRHTGLLLKKLEIPKKRMISYHGHNERESGKYIASEIEKGISVALVSDAGTPGISDPGYRLVGEAINKGIRIISLPGPTAFAPALTASGFPTNNFLFLGFPPQKKGRKAFIQNALSQPFTTVFYESPHRIEKFIGELIDSGNGEREICIAREISKIYEEYIRGTAIEIRDRLSAGGNLKGEMVIVIKARID